MNSSDWEKIDKFVKIVSEKKHKSGMIMGGERAGSGFDTGTVHPAGGDAGIGR